MDGTDQQTGEIVEPGQEQPATSEGSGGESGGIYGPGPLEPKVEEQDDEAAEREQPHADKPGRSDAPLNRDGPPVRPEQLH